MELLAPSFCRVAVHANPPRLFRRVSTAMKSWLFLIQSACKRSARPPEWIGDRQMLLTRFEAGGDAVFCLSVNKPVRVSRGRRIP